MPAGRRVNDAGKPSAVRDVMYQKARPKKTKGSIMFKWDELEDLKKAALDRDAFNEVVIYQNEQMLRELKSMAWRLKELNEKNV